MNGLLGCLLTLFIFILLSVLLFLLRLGSLVFKFRRTMRKHTGSTQQESETHRQTHDKPAQKQKIYAPDEGEYVDFEEVHDDAPQG